MTLRQPTLALLAIAAITIVAATVLAALHVVVPDWFRDVATVAVGAAGGVALPAHTAPPQGGGQQ